MEYTIVGDDSATALFNVDQTGRITVASTLRTDPAEQYRV